MDKLTLGIGFCLAAGFVVTVIALIFTIVLLIRFTRIRRRNNLKRIARKGRYPEPGNYDRYIYGRRSGRAAGTKKKRKKIIRNVKKGR